MSRVKLTLPNKFSFSCNIPVRITDINYGNHVGNDSILSILHEARMQFLKSMGYSELEFGGIGMIMADVAIEFKKEIFYGDVIKASVTIGEISAIGFELYYLLEVSGIAVIARTNMICYDYPNKKVVKIPTEVLEKFKHYGA